MHSREIRRVFLEYFAQRGHRVVPSSPLVLPRDPTLLFANAGMNQFKDVFTGREQRDYRRAVSVQKCLRVSGKHNDLEQVGRTPRHHTFFEMLGNFSFGDYFKREALAWAWDLVTRVFGLPPERLWVTVFGGSAAAPPDEEAWRLWQEIAGLPEERILRQGEADNFWRMGETGPCGPCSEIHYDLGEVQQGAAQASTPATDSERFLEIWNLVFMQFEQQEDGRLEPLPAPSIDTGMGLERMAAVLQGTTSNYETDLFLPLLEAASRASGRRYGEDEEADVSLRVIADHVRAICFLVADGVVPANDKRGYVLRRILRRAIRHGRKLGVERPFLHEIAPVVLDLLGEVYPELVAAREAIFAVCRREEARFAETLGVGLELLEARLAEIVRDASRPRVVPGEELFRLYDTFGLPLDLARDIAAERGIALDEVGFEEAMARQRARAQPSWRGARPERAAAVYRELRQRGPTRFEGYTRTELEGVRVVALLREGRPVPLLADGGEGEAVLEATPFYAEAGGQVGDSGWLAGPEGRARVLDTQRPVEGLIVHRIRLETGRLAVDDRVRAEVDRERREAIRRNHTATHLLHAALREIVGPHVKQAGSLVAPDRLRFDFTHFAGLSDRALADIEALVNEKILEDLAVEEAWMSLEEALRQGAIALFGEKYGDEVRVISIGEFSRELCGGTHTRHLGEIGLFKLTEERSVASGTRRLEALTGTGSLRAFQEEEAVLRALEQALAVPRGEVLREVERRMEQLRQLQRELERLRLGSVRQRLLERARRPAEAGRIKVLAERVDGVSAAQARELADALRQQLGSGVVVLGRAEGEKAALLVAVTDDLKAQLPAVRLARELGRIIGGGGGGRDDLAEAGGRRPERLDEALRAAVEVVARSAEASA